MKKSILILFTAASLFACNSECKKTENNENEQVTAANNTEGKELKDHVCTAECKPGACVLAHGEEGHECTAECKVASAETAAVDETTLKDHVCTAECKPGACVLAHGEKGHRCDEKCL